MNNQNKPIYLGVPILVILTLIIGLILGSELPTRKRNQAEHYSNSGVDKLGEVMHHLNKHYIDTVCSDSLIEGILPQLLTNLDPHTAYIPSKDLEQVNSELEGSFFGIGISYQIMNDTITVVEIISGGPSERVGLMTGDRIVEINDSVMVNKGLVANDVLKLLRGENGSKVKLGIKRNGAKELLPFEIIRGEIKDIDFDYSEFEKMTDDWI